jgi:hypothetical protein
MGDRGIVMWGKVVLIWLAVQLPLGLAVSHFLAVRRKAAEEVAEQGTELTPPMERAA